MGGRDKGLVPYQGRPLAAWVLDRLVAQTGTQFAVANRNLPDYASLLQHSHATPPSGVPAVLPDAPDLPVASGPLAGIVTALRHTATPWLMVTPCDTPHLPDDLVERLLAEAERWLAPVADEDEPADAEWRAHRLKLGVTEGRAELGSDATLWLECNAAELNGVSFTVDAGEAQLYAESGSDLLESLVWDLTTKAGTDSFPDDVSGIVLDILAD